MAWAGDTQGPGRHYAEWKPDQTYNVSSIYYAQRDFANHHDPAFDQVTFIDIWAGNSPFAPNNPGFAPSATVPITDITDDTFLEYALGTTITGQYFLIAARNPLYSPGQNGFIGGTDFRLGGEVPEPATLSMIAPIALLLRRRPLIHNS